MTVSDTAPTDLSLAGGLGSEVLRSSCTRFDLDVTPTGATLTASVPLL
jgi:hypothetical protein